MLNTQNTPNTQNTQKLQYENVFKSRGTLYARLFDPCTKTACTKAVKSIPNIFIPTKNKKEATPGLISIPEKTQLKKLSFKTMKEYREAFNLYKASNVPMYGNKSQKQTYIRENWKNPVECFHEFSNIWFWDIEVAVLDDSVPKKVSRSDWKPTGHERSAMATITSIQIYDTKAKMFFILGLKKEWKNKDNFTSTHGEIKYIRCKSEVAMLKTFLELLKRRDPAIITGWNTASYDDPYLTNRIIRVLDGRDDLYIYDKNSNTWKFNTDCLNGNYVKQLSPWASLIHHKEVQTNFGPRDEFKWVGIIQEDYLNLYKKYTYTVHTSYSLDTIAKYELGSNKVNHDEFTDFRKFYEEDFDTFIKYGIQDVSLLIELDQKLKLIDLAKFIAYICGVTMDDIRGTVKQWNSYMFNNHLNKGQVLPLESKFGKNDTVLLKHAVDMKDLDEKRKHKFRKLLNNPKTHGQTFPGGITRGTAKFWEEVFSLDFGSLYPSVIQWANIGIETLIQPKDLPKELLDLRAKYAIYYEKVNISPKDLVQLDIDFANNILGNPKIREEIQKTLAKYNVSMTPNGMFFDKSTRSVLSQTMEDIIVQRTVHKKKMKQKLKEIQELKNSKKHYKNHKEYKEKLETLQALADMENVYQMALKILINACYGSLSLLASIFAGDKEYFSGAVTSSARIANLIAGQVNSKKIDEIAGLQAKEIQYNMKSYLDNIPQQDTDSVLGDSIIYVNGEKIKIQDFYKNTPGKLEKRGPNNYIKYIDHIDHISNMIQEDAKTPFKTLSLNKDTGVLENKKIKYIMAHKVKKRIFKIKDIKHKAQETQKVQETQEVQEVQVTEDHSIIIKRNGIFQDIKPKDIKKGDKIIKIKPTDFTEPIDLIDPIETEDFIVQNLGIQEHWVYDIEVQDNHNFFANDICVHNSNYISIKPVIVKRFGKDYRKTQTRERITEFTVNYINKISLPITYEILKVYSKTMNAHLPEKLVEDPEVICDNFISIAPKMYFARKFWDEGLTLTKPKLKVTGLSMVRASTPKFFRQKLEKAMDILIDGDIPKVIDFIKKVKAELPNQRPSQICINQSVSSLDYTWQEDTKKYKKWDQEKNKWLSAPINSRASLIHNKYIGDNNITEIKDIEPGDKIGFIYMKEPNIIGSNVFAFNNEKIFELSGLSGHKLDDYIDRELMFQKGFENNIKLITDPIGWDLTPEDEQIKEDEW